jgi:beta-glucosidase
MDRDVDKLISQMTLEEKAGLCSGLDDWQTKEIKRLGIPSITMTDGPNGLAKKDRSAAKQTMYTRVPATCFPSSVALACSWDKKLMEELGAALAEEFHSEGINIICGPGANIKRSPLCGRNFEYYSEDPLLSAEITTGYIKGVQNNGVGTALKHYALNNQEHRRMSVDVVADERTLREIYLASFEGIVKNTQPWTVMCAYNSVNGGFCSQNRYLLTDILKEEWGHEGFVMSDWGAVNERVKGLEAGLELEMPYSNGLGDRQIVEAVKTGKLPVSILDNAVARILKVILKVIDNKKENATYDKQAHHKLARKIASECMVLLKNKDKILPLKKQGTLAVIGAFAQNPRFQGGGSAHVNPSKIDDTLGEIRRAAGDSVQIAYAEGYRLESDAIDEKLMADAIKAAANSDVAVIFAGLPDRYECEGYDRKHMRIPENHEKLIEAVAGVQGNVVVVLCNGSPVEMPWLGKVNGVLEAYLGGQAFGGAIADLLFGDSNPCGKLAETFPKKLGHNPSHLNFPGEGDKVEYREGIFVGYRYYDTKGIEPLFPFGYGLSYTDFAYTDIAVDKRKISDTETLKVTVKVKNTGKMAGKETVQLYVKDMESSVIRPEKELKAFEKVELRPGEEKEVTFELNKRAFAYYNVDIKDWYVETGDFELLVGRSSQDIMLKETVHVKSSGVIKKRYNRNTPIGDLRGNPVVEEIFKQLSAGMSGMKDEPEMFEVLLKNTPLHSTVKSGGEAFTEEMLDAFLEELNKGK